MFALQMISFGYYRQRILWNSCSKLCTSLFLLDFVQDLETIYQHASLQHNLPENSKQNIGSNANITEDALLAFACFQYKIEKADFLHIFTRSCPSRSILLQIIRQQVFAPALHSCQFMTAIHEEKRSCSVLFIHATSGSSCGEFLLDGTQLILSTN